MSLTLVQKGSSRAAIRLGFDRNLKNVRQVCANNDADKKEIEAGIVTKYGSCRGSPIDWLEFEPVNGWKVVSVDNRSRVQVPDGWVK